MLLATPMAGFAQQPPSSPPVTAAPSTATPAVTEAAIEPEPILPHDLTPIGMFMAADIVVKAVMIGLALASVLTWSVWLAKTIELAGAKRRLRRDLGIVEQALSLRQELRRAAARPTATSRCWRAPPPASCGAPAMRRATTASRNASPRCLRGSRRRRRGG